MFGFKDALRHKCDLHRLHGVKTIRVLQDDKWLRGLPPLKPTDVVDGREQRIWKMPPSKDRWKLRSITYQGIANAMADQWG